LPPSAISPSPTPSLSPGILRLTVWNRLRRPFQPQPSVQAPPTASSRRPSPRNQFYQDSTAEFVAPGIYFSNTLKCYCLLRPPSPPMSPSPGSCSTPASVTINIAVWSGQHRSVACASVQHRIGNRYTCKSVGRLAGQGAYVRSNSFANSFVVGQ
jgi:hypothetical protein